MHPHLPANMGQNLVSVFQLNAEHRVRKRFPDDPLNFNYFFFWHPTLSKRQLPCEHKGAAT